MHKGDAIEELLRRAAPRASPPGDDERAVREAVRTEWRVAIGRRRARRRLASAAIAATVLLAVTVNYDSFPGAGVAPVELATIDKSHGSIFLQGEQAQPVPVDGLATIHAGQTMTTGHDAAAGLAWAGGGSLRVDKDTQIEIVSAAEVYLHTGRVYFDSDGADTASPFAIRTPHGVVSHVGTRYMTAADSDRLVVSVREGRVEIEGRYFDRTAHAGQQVEIAGGARPEITRVTGTGADWEWIEQVSPNLDVDGKPAYEFLQWVGRETGYRVVFASDTAERIARESLLVGTVESDPRTELRLRMLTIDLDAAFDVNRSALVIDTSQ